MINYQPVSSLPLSLLAIICSVLTIIIIGIGLPVVFRVFLFFPLYLTAQKLTAKYQIGENKKNASLFIALVATIIIVFF